MNIKQLVSRKFAQLLDLGRQNDDVYLAKFVALIAANIEQFHLDIVLPLFYLVSLTPNPSAIKVNADIQKSTNLFHYVAA